MTAYKPRLDGSFEAAIVKAMGLLGVGTCASAIGKSASYVYRCSNPDDDSTLSLAQGYALDLAALEAGHDPPIIHAWHAALSAARAPAHQAQPPLTRLASVIVEVGDVGRAVSAAVADRKVTASEAASIAVECDQAIEALTRLKRDTMPGLRSVTP